MADTSFLSAVGVFYVGCVVEMGCKYVVEHAVRMYGTDWQTTFLLRLFLPPSEYNTPL